MSRTLSESASKELLARFGVPFAPEHLVTDASSAVAAAEELGYPVVATLCGDRVAHKTERGLVRLGLRGPDELRRAVDELLAAATDEDEATGVLVAPMVRGNRELIAGVSTDPQFGATVLVGVGGVLAEALADVAVRPAPISRVDAEEMIDQLRTRDLLGPFRGEPPVDRSALVDVLLALSEAASVVEGLRSVDLNPLVVHDGRPIAVDALVELDLTAAGAR